MEPQSLYSQLWERGGNRWVLSLVLNVRRHCEDVASDGRLFQVLAAATGNARSPIVESRVITRWYFRLEICGNDFQCLHSLTFPRSHSHFHFIPTHFHDNTFSHSYFPPTPVFLIRTHNPTHQYILNASREMYSKPLIHTRTVVITYGCSHAWQSRRRCNLCQGCQVIEANVVSRPN